MWGEFFIIKRPVFFNVSGIGGSLKHKNIRKHIVLKFYFKCVTKIH
jgi:hypothetical protein